MQTLTRRRGARSKNDRCACFRTCWLFKTHLPYHLGLSPHFLCTSSVLPCMILLLTAGFCDLRSPDSLLPLTIQMTQRLSAFGGPKACSAMIRELLGCH